MKFLLAWLVPTWIVFELVITKLPHYVLPLYPAIAILLAGMHRYARLSRTRWMECGTFWWFVVPASAAVVGVALTLRYEGDFGWRAWPLLAASVVFGLRAWWLYEVDGAERSLLRACAASILLAMATFWGVIPSLTSLFPSDAVARAVHASECKSPQVAAAGFSEPSLVFLLGTDTLFTDAAGAADFLMRGPCRFAVIEAQQDRQFVRRAEVIGLRYDKGTRFSGFSIGSGSRIVFTIYNSRRRSLDPSLAGAPVETVIDASLKRGVSAARLERRVSAAEPIVHGHRALRHRVRLAVRPGARRAMVRLGLRRSASRSAPYRRLTHAAARRNIGSIRSPPSIRAGCRSWIGGWIGSFTDSANPAGCCGRSRTRFWRRCSRLDSHAASARNRLVFTSLVGTAVFPVFGDRAAGSVVSIVKPLIGRVRPFVDGRSIRSCISRSPISANCRQHAVPEYFDGSMPSGHTATAFAVAGRLRRPCGRRLRPLLMASMRSPIALSRLVIGAHHSERRDGRRLDRRPSARSLVRNWFAHRPAGLRRRSDDGRVYAMPGPSLRVALVAGVCQNAARQASDRQCWFATSPPEAEAMTHRDFRSGAISRFRSSFRCATRPAISRRLDRRDRAALARPMRVRDRLCQRRLDRRHRGRTQAPEGAVSRGCGSSRMKRSCGQSAAVRTGVRRRAAPVIVTLDGDGQNDPRFLPKLIADAGSGRAARRAGRRPARRPQGLRLSRNCSRASPTPCAARSCATAPATPAAA